jgi:hypothetical protein
MLQDREIPNLATLALISTTLTEIAVSILRMIQKFQDHILHRSNAIYLHILANSAFG